jgi:hypothetical protein
MMRKYLQEGDLISAEVQKVYDDGSLSLYTRSLKYGKVTSYCHQWLYFLKTLGLSGLSIFKFSSFLHLFTHLILLSQCIYFL